MERIVLRLYVTGHTPRSQAAISNLQIICRTELDGRYEIEVVDVLTDPRAAERERILATPTLIKELPPPLSRVIGDLSDHERVLAGLGIVRVHPAVPEGHTT